MPVNTLLVTFVTISTQSVSRSRYFPCSLLRASARILPNCRPSHPGCAQGVSHLDTRA